MPDICIVCDNECGWGQRGHINREWQEIGVEFWDLDPEIDGGPETREGWVCGHCVDTVDDYYDSDDYDGPSYEDLLDSSDLVEGYTESEDQDQYKLGEMTRGLEGLVTQAASRPEAGVIDEALTRIANRTINVDYASNWIVVNNEDAPTLTIRWDSDLQSTST